MLEGVGNWDRETLIFLNNLGSETYDSFWSVVTNISTWIPLYILFFLLIMSQYRRREGLMVSLTIVLTLLITHLLTDFSKAYFERLRPNNDLGLAGMIRILKQPQSFSFFSGHASTSFAVTTLVLLFMKKYRGWFAILFIWPLLFSFSRIYVGVHYPSDLIVGGLVGTSLAFLFYRGYRRFIAPC